MARLPIVALALTATLAACATGGGMEDAGADSADMPAAEGQTAYAQLLDAQGMTKGRAVLTEQAGGVQVTGMLQNVQPGTYGFHIHETGQCVPPDFTSAGGHWNPTEQPHPQHKGDLPNVTINADGTGQVSGLIADVTLTGGTTPLIDSDGAAVMLHAGADDMQSQPSGDAGARLACGPVTAQ